MPYIALKKNVHCLIISWDRYENLESKSVNTYVGSGFEERLYIIALNTTN